MATTTRGWADGTAMAVRAVLAGNYRGRSEDRATVTHAVIVDADGDEVGAKTLCGYAVENPVACPTCPRCAKKAAS